MHATVFRWKSSYISQIPRHVEHENNSVLRDERLYAAAAAAGVRGRAAIRRTTQTRPTDCARARARCGTLHSRRTGSYDAHHTRLRHGTVVRVRRNNNTHTHTHAHCRVLRTVRGDRGALHPVRRTDGLEQPVGRRGHRHYCTVPPRTAHWPFLPLQSA